MYNDGQCIVDSGTTLLAMPHSAYTAFYSALHTMCENGRSLTGVCGQTYSGGLFGGYSFVMSKEEIEAFPSVTVVLSVRPAACLVMVNLFLCAGSRLTPAAGRDTHDPSSPLPHHRQHRLHVAWDE